MVFRTVSEDSVLRDLITIYQGHAREVIEIFRKILSMIDDLNKGDRSDIEARLKEVEAIHAKSLEIKRSMMKELNQTGTLLIDREDLSRLIGKLGEIVDYIEAIAMMISEMAEMGWKVPSELQGGMVQMAEATFETLVKLRESLLALGMNSPRALNFAKEVEDGEQKVDKINRQMHLKVITCKAELPVVLLLKDIVQYMEDTTDRALEAADMIRILIM